MVATVQVDVTELAIQAKTDPSLMAPLWDAVSRLIGFWARDYTANRTNARSGHLWDTDDLVQSGYFALVKAVEKYDPNSEAKFTTYLRFHVRTQFAEVAGRRSERQKKQSEFDHAVLMLDASLTSETDTTGADVTPDPSADFAASLIERDALQQDCADLMEEIDKLPDDQRAALLLTSWRGMTVKAAAIVIGAMEEEIKRRKAAAARTVRNSATGRRIYQERYATIRRVGLTQFKSTHISEVEKHILWMEDHGLL